MSSWPGIFVYKVFVFLAVIASVNCQNPNISQGMSTSFLDISIYLKYLPSLMSSVGIQNLAAAAEVFIESNLSYNSIPVDDVKVLVSSQTLDGRTIMGLDSTFHVVQANMQILVKIQSSSDRNDEYAPLFAENLIRKHFTEDWTELRAMLLLLDPEYFQRLTSIELKPNAFDQNDGLPGEDTAEVSDALPRNVLIFYMILGFCIMLASLLLVITFCLGRKTHNGSTRETITSSFGSDADDLSHYKEGVEGETQIAMKATAAKTKSSGSVETAQSSGIYLFRKSQQIENIRNDPLQQNGGYSIQSPSASETYSTFLRKLKTSKYAAEHSFRQSLKEVLQQSGTRTSDEVMESGESRSSKSQKISRNVPVDYLVPMSSREASSSKTEGRSSEQLNGIEARPRNKASKRQPSRKDPQQLNISRLSAVHPMHHPGITPNCRTMPSGKKSSTMQSKARNFRDVPRSEMDIARRPTRTTQVNEKASKTMEVDVLSTQFFVACTNTHDGCSVSTITGFGSTCYPEFIEYGGVNPVRSEARLGIPHGQGYPADDEEKTLAMIAGDEDADEFGSIANSCPGSADLA